MSSPGKFGAFFNFFSGAYQLSQALVIAYLIDIKRFNDIKVYKL